VRDAILVINAGSSSLKFSVYADGRDGANGPEAVLRGQVEGLPDAARFRALDGSGEMLAEHAWPPDSQPGHEGALDYLLQFLEEQAAEHRLIAVGHRVVHGGLQWSQPVRVDPEILAGLEQFVPLAPLHQRQNLAPIRQIAARRPDLPQVACFDTAFHRHQPEVAQAFALPPEITARGVRRYSFHGLSYEYVAGVLPKYEPRAASGKVVVAHLGAGASMCAIEAGRSIGSTMGFTAIEGLPMGTRCGSIDPGVPLYLMSELGMDLQAVERLLHHQSGLLGVSGLSSDMRVLLASDEPRARFAIDLFVYRIARELGSLAAALGGLDALVFTGGIGEHAAPIRARVCRDAAWLGVELDPEANQRGGPCITRPGSRVSAWVIPTNEELMIARHTRALVAG
jgi:acetate kinase